MVARPLIRLALDLAFPPACPACDGPVAADGRFCPGCALSLYELGPACPRCAEPASGPRAVPCARCTRRPPPFARTAAAYRYGGELAVALRRLKLENRPDVARALAPLFQPSLTLAAARADVAVPLPLSPRRLASRTFNQTQVLLDHAARGLPIRRDPALLRRVRHTPSQAGLGPAARWRNVEGAFAAPPRAERRLGGRRVLLVDDIMTTGATLAAAASAALAAGAAEVSCFVFARAEG